MNEFFFVTTYDKISSVILSSLMNLHPDFKCDTKNTATLTPTAINKKIDDFIRENTSADKKISGNIGNFAAYELQLKLLTQKTAHPFRRANIVLSPKLRTRLLLASWRQTGLSAEKILVKIKEETASDFINNGLLKAYNFTYFFNILISDANKLLQHLVEYYQNNPNAPNNIQYPRLDQADAKLTILAMALVLTFDSADLPVPGKTFSFEKILLEDVELTHFLQYLSRSELSFSSEFFAEIHQKREDISTYLNNIQSDEWQDWQTIIMNNFLSRKLKTVYYFHLDKKMDYYYSLYGYTVDKSKQITYSKLLSIQLNSNRPAQFVAFLDNIEETADNPQQIEVLVNIDIGDEMMKSVLIDEIPRRKFTLKYIQSPKPSSFYDLWKPLNKLLEITDPQVYFVLNLSDEIFFAKKGWDTALKKYVGYFPDNIFRLRASRNKFRNYFDRWECNFAQDCMAFTTRKWLQIVGDWNPCFGPDSFQQLIAFYLAKEAAFSHEKLLRDIPIFDVEFTGDVPGLELIQEYNWKMCSDGIRAMQVCQSYKMQTEARRRAVLLKANIMIEEKQIHGAQLIESKEKKLIQIKVGNKVVASMGYKLSWFSITLVNQWRKIYFHSYFGGGLIHKSKPLVGLVYYLGSKHLFFLNLLKSVVTPCQKIAKRFRKFKEKQNNKKLQTKHATMSNAKKAKVT